MPASTIELRHIIPGAGLVIQDQKPVTARPERDKIILTKLQQAGIIGAAYKDRNKHRRDFNTALEAMFTAAAKPELRSKLQKPTKNAAEDSNDDDEDGYLDYIDAVKAQVNWAESLTSSVFADFFTALLRARVQWNENPREPLDKNKHSAAAKAIQSLLDSEPDL